MNDVIWGGITVKTVVALLGGGLGVSIVVQVVKRVFKLTSAKVVQFLVVALSTIASCLAYVISAVHANPGLALGHAAGLLGIANAAHTFIVSDADQFIQKVRTALSSQGTQAAPTGVETSISSSVSAINTSAPTVDASSTTPPAASF